MERDNDTSGVNTILIVIVLLILVAFGVWWFTRAQPATTQQPAGASINVNLPAGGNDNSDSGQENQ